MKLDSSPWGISPFFRIELHFVDVAPSPVLTGLEAAYHRVIRAVEMLGCVLVRRRVAAPDMATGEAEAEMYPPVAALEALFAALRSSWRDVFDLIQMAAGSLHV